MAVNDSSANGGAGKITGMQLSPGTVDSAGNVYVAYPESIHAYPNYDGAAIKYVWAPGNLSHWSAPVTVAPSGGAGNVLPHVIAGSRGQLDFAYFVGSARPGRNPAWRVVVAQTRNALARHPAFWRTKVSGGIVTYTGTASQLMGACATGPLEGVQNGFACNRSTDVWGIALDHSCRLLLAWPVADKSFNNTDPKAAGTYVSTQIGGTRICA
jgi:hypothetical protein